MKNVKRKIQKIPSLLFWMLLCCLTASAQQGMTVRGIVLYDDGEGIIGASIVVKGNKSIGTISDFDGNFQLTVPNEKSILVISFVGMKTREVKVSRSNMRITLEDDSQEMDEVVVVGYGQQKKASVVGAITQTTSKVLERSGGVSDLGSALTGNLPGVVTTASTGMPGEEDPQILVRGMSSWNNTAPLILVDGIERPMAGIDINSVASISVLKDASATAVYGVKGANGVILITTKRGSEGKATINAGASMAFKIPSKLPNKMDSYDAFALRNSAIEYELGLVPDSWTDMVPRDIMNKYRNPANLEEAERYPNVDETMLSFIPKSRNDFAGLAVYQDEQSNIILGKTIDADGNQVMMVKARSKNQVKNAYLDNIPVDKQDKWVQLRVEMDAKDGTYNFYYRYAGDEDWISLRYPINATMLSTGTVGGFTGCVIGAYACKKIMVDTK